MPALECQRIETSATLKYAAPSTQETYAFTIFERVFKDFGLPNAIRTNDRIWLVSFMEYDLGFFDDETSRLEPAVNPFEAKVLPMSPV